MITIQDNSQIVMLDTAFIDDTRHLQYHSRFDLEHIKTCDSCRSANEDFNNEPEFDEEQE